MEHLPKEQIRREKERLAAGRPPKPWFGHRVQRTAARGLAAFFALMLALTLLSRAASGFTTARVTVENPKTGVLTQRLTAQGQLEAQGDWNLTLPAGIPIERIVAATGQQVQPGDVLLVLDRAEIARTLEQWNQERKVLDLRIDNASRGNTSADTDAIAAAQAALEDAQEDYERLLGRREDAEGRAAEDLELARAECDTALLELERAGEKAKEALVKAAQEKVDAAQEQLDAVREAAQSAIEAAQSQLTSAQDAQNSYSAGYYKAVSELGDLEDSLRQAQQTLAELMEAGAGEAELQAAQARVDELQAAVKSAQWSVPNYNYSADLAVQRAKDNLKKVEGKQAEKVEQAQQKLEEVQGELEKTEARTDMSEEPLVVTAQGAVDAARRALESAQRGQEDAGAATQDQLLAAQRAVESAQRGLESARAQAEQTRQSDASARRQAEIERLGYVSQRRALQQKIDELAAAVDGEVRSPIAGTVRSIVEETWLTQEGARAEVIARSDRGFQFVGTLPEEEAEQLAAGDEGVLTFTSGGKSQEVRAAVSSIGAADEKGQVAITATLPEGGYPTGVSAQLECSKRSEQYPVCLTLGALRSGGGDDFVLVLREKQTVLGIEQTVVRVPVTVKARDKEQMAVESGGLLSTDRVVVSASKPIEEGDRVRVEAAKAE